MTSRGDIWWVDFGGEVGRHPALVLTRDPTSGRIDRPTVAMVTTNERGLRSEARIGPDDGMPRPCVVSLDNVGTAPRARFVRLICTLSDERMADVCDALNFALGC